MEAGGVEPPSASADTSKPVAPLNAGCLFFDAIGVEVQLLWCVVEVAEESRAEPAFHLVLIADVRVTIVGFASPRQGMGVLGIGIRRERQAESVTDILRIDVVVAQCLGDDLTHAADEGFGLQAVVLVIEDPLPTVPVAFEGHDCGAGCDFAMRSRGHELTF